jgi:CBS domain-containing protein
VLKHQGYPVVDASDKLVGVVTRRNLLEEWIALPSNQPGANGDLAAPIVTYDLLGHEPIVVRSWESCRSAAERMAQEGVGRLVVVADDAPGKVIGIITRSDLMKARARQVEEEMIRKRHIKLQPGDSDEVELERTTH